MLRSSVRMTRNAAAASRFSCSRVSRKPATTAMSSAGTGPGGFAEFVAEVADLQVGQNAVVVPHGAGEQRGAGQAVQEAEGPGRAPVGREPAAPDRDAQGLGGHVRERGEQPAQRAGE